jgi:hypothetical protein
MATLQISQWLKAVLQRLLVVGVVALGIVVLFVAWWIAVTAVLALGLYVGVRRLFPRRARSYRTRTASSAGPMVIEGEYRVEPEDVPAPLKDRSASV